MEQKVGNYAVADESYSAGVATAKATVAIPETKYGLKVNVSVEADLDAKTLVGYLAAKIGGPVPTEVAAFIESALAVT